jgi:hypothetical protein
MITYFFRHKDNIHSRYLNLVLLCLIFFLNVDVKAQGPETIESGSFIINMGITPQNEENGLRPYGMVYDLLKNFQVPIKWVINPTKSKDGVDFTYSNVSYRGGAFVVPAEFRTAAVNSRISFWQGRGVVGATTTSPVTLSVSTTLHVVPKWTLDQDNGDIAAEFFSLAEIPASAHGGSSSSGWVKPGNLTCCDDLFVMPHADPAWSTHSRLLSWNLECKGSIWLGCHAGSALEDMFNPSNKSEQTNFLTEKTGIATGNGPYSENALILWNNHDDGTPPYTYDFPTDPVMQFMGKLDNATRNGSEQVYVPLSQGWRSTTNVGVYDPDQPDRVSDLAKNRPAIVAWGRGFGDDDRGLVMMEASHNIAKSSSSDNVAAMRAFFNFSLLALSDKAVVPSLSGLTPTLFPAQDASLQVTVPAPANISDYTIMWSSSCGGTFSPNSGANVTFTAPNASSTLPCKITATIVDACGRETFASQFVTIQCNQSVTNIITQVCGSNPNSGEITLTVTGGNAPYAYTWTRLDGGSGSGSGINITGLSADTYTVTVTSANGCAEALTFTTTVSSSPAIIITPTVLPVLCNGDSTGGINLNVSGGTPGYTYNWGDSVTTQNRNELLAGNYSVTVTDIRGCTATLNGISVTAPTALTATSTVNNVPCFGESTGSTILNASGGTAPYTYQWNDGTATKDLSNLNVGTYSVDITDANNCTSTLSNITVTQPLVELTSSLSNTLPTCGVTDGSITASTSGGTAPYSYDWLGTPIGDSTAIITALSGGTYQLIITDANNCTLVKTENLIAGRGILLTNQATNITCLPGSNTPLTGVIDLTVSGGTAPFTYDWTTIDGVGLAPTQEDQINLIAGTYTVMVTDAANCTGTTTVALTNINSVAVKPIVINNN